MKKTRRTCNKTAFKKKKTREEAGQGIIKHYLTSKRNICKVTFRLPKAAAPAANEVNLVGEFNNWDNNALFMKKLKDGDFVTTIHLEAGREYQFRYLIDNSRWENDWNADRYVPTPFGSNNSVVTL